MFVQDQHVDITARFLERNNLKLLVRAHEVKQEGFEWQKGGKCVTLPTVQLSGKMPDGRRGRVWRLDKAAHRVHRATGNPRKT